MSILMVTNKMRVRTIHHSICELDVMQQCRYLPKKKERERVVSWVVMCVFLLNESCTFILLFLKETYFLFVWWSSYYLEAWRYSRLLYL